MYWQGFIICGQNILRMLFLNTWDAWGHPCPLVAGVYSRDVAIAGYIDEGCYTEATNMRALTGNAYYNDQMTVEACAAACSSFLWFGVEYGRECYCGDTINPGNVSAPSTDCSFACPGNSAETCGAGSRLNMYTKTSNTAAPAPPTAPSTGYASQGCYTEATNGRALTAKSTNVNTMTVEMCAASCAGYTYFGLEYTTECYCGNTLMAGSVTAPASDCKYSCPGNHAESCGGDSRLNVYQFGGTAVAPPPPAVSTYNFVSCYTEASNGRALTGLAYFNDALTTELCSTACLGFAYFGTEYGRECYCGNSFNPGSVPADNSQCNFPCPGNAGELCGGQDRLDVYQYGPPTVSSTSSSIISSTSTSSSSISSTTLTTSTSSSSLPTSTSSSSSPSSTSSSSSPSSTSSSSLPSSPSTTAIAAASSTTTSSSSSSTSSSAPACATPVIDGGFESATVPWVVKNVNAALSYNFQVSSATTAPNSGTQSGSITYNAGAGALQGWYNEVITLCPNKVYNFSAWTKATLANPGCNVYYYIGNPAGTTVISIITLASSAQLSTNWVHSTGQYSSGLGGAVSMNVRLTCAGTTVTTRSFYMDDISLVAN